MRRWCGLVLIGIAFLSAAVAVVQLPARVTLDFSRLVPFSLPAPSESASSLVVFVLPAAAAAVWALLRWLKSGSAARLARALWGNRVPASALDAHSIERFESTYDVIANFVVTLLVAFHFLLLTIALTPGTGFLRAILASVGVLLMLAGNLMPRLRPNPVMGVRTGSTLRDPQLWARTHRILGMLFMLAGLATVTAAVAAPRFALAIALVGVLCAGVLVGVFLAAQRSRSGRTAVLVAVALHIAAASALRAQVPVAVPPADVREEALSFTSAGVKRTESLDPNVQKPLYNDLTVPIVAELVPAIVRWLRRH